MESADPPVRRPWGLGEVGLMLLAGFVGSVLTTGLWVAVSGSSEESLGLLIAGLAGLWIGDLAVVVWALRRRGYERPLADLGWGFRARDFVTGTLAGLATSVLAIPIVYTALLETGVLDDSHVERLSDPAERIADTGQGLGWVVMVLFVGVGAPVVEELVFRGFMQPAFVRRIGVVPGIVVTAAVFGGVHFQALQFVALFVFGLVLGWLAHRSGRLGPCIVAHVVFNCLTLIQLA